MDPKSLVLKIGDLDLFGNSVTRVFSVNPEKKYAVWEITSGDVLVDADDDRLANDQDIATWTVKLGGLIARRKEAERRYNSHIAHAYKLCLDGDKSSAIALLKEGYEEIREAIRREHRSKAAYLIGSLAVTCTCLVTCWYQYLYHGDNAQIARFLGGLSLSSLGGFMSVAAGLRRQVLQVEEGAWLNALYGALRIAVVMIAGIVATFMISTGVALSFLVHEDAFGGFLLACFVAGYSERFIAKALNQIESVA